jgi:sulfatase maturation enzyme AslB (radical SAM superfamily)
MINFSDIQELHLEPTSKCNAACPQCGRTEPDGSVNKLLNVSDMSIDKAMSMFPPHFIKQLKSMFMCGSYGDPAAANDAIDIFKHFRQINPNIKLAMHTNGSLRSTKWWAELGQIFNGEHDYVTFSLDGLEDTNHTYRVNTIWPKIIENVKAFIAAGGKAHWSMLVYAHNEHQVQEALETARDLGFKRFYCKVSKRIEYVPVSFLNYPKNFESSDQVFTNEIVCQAQKEKSIYATADGFVLPCCYIGAAVLSQRPYTRMNALAHIGSMDRADSSKHRIEEIVAGKAFTNFSDTWDKTPAHICKNSCSKKVEGGTRERIEWRTDVWF